MWHSLQFNKYYFCIVDSVEALTDSKDPSDYFKNFANAIPNLIFS